MSRKFLQMCLFTGVAVAAGWLTVRYVLPISLPFLLGLLLALASEPGVRLLHGRLRFPRKMATAVSVSLVFLLFATVLTLLVGLLMRQVTRLQAILPQLEAAASQAITLLEQWLASLADKLPKGMHDAVNRLAETDLSGGNMAGQALQRVSQMATGLLSKLSAGLFGIFTGLISGYMLSARLPLLRQNLRSHLPAVWEQKMLPALQGMRTALGGWFLAQLKLTGVTFVLLWIGFLLLRIPNALLVAALSALVDAFPVLGVGTVLVPWSLVNLLQGNQARGLGLLALYGTVSLIRSVLEPRVVGKGIGLDPLVTLAAIYAGWQLLGIPGMLLAPIFAMAVQQMIKALKS